MADDERLRIERAAALQACIAALGQLSTAQERVNVLTYLARCYGLTLVVEN